MAGAYTATAGAVNGAITGLGTLVMVEPQAMGAVLGMGTGLLTGLYLFSD